MWCVVADLLHNTTARVVVNGSASAPWTESAGVRQGSVLGPLLFNILFNGIADAVRAVCPGVALGPEAAAPRVTLLLYADDLVVLAETADSLQRALDAVGAWGARWHFSFGIGPDKTASMVFGARSQNFRFSLHGNALPCVSCYKYLGVTFQSSGKWREHGARLVEKCRCRFYQFLGWAENRQLHTGYRSSLFRTYVLPSMMYGAQFLDSAWVARLDKIMRQWGRRLLLWPTGAPSAAVLGELGWPPLSVEVARARLGLFGRLSVVPGHDVRRGLASRVFNFAQTQPHSWAYEVAQSLNQYGISLPSSWGIFPGASEQLVSRWIQHHVRPALQRVAQSQYHCELAALTSLADYAVFQPRLGGGNCIHESNIPTSIVRDWTLARCGHHPFADGRSARHSLMRHQVCLCGTGQWEFLHALRYCPLLNDQRRRWLQRLGLQHVPPIQDWDLVRWIFDPQLMSTNAVMSAHVRFIASICDAARSLQEGLRPRRLPRAVDLADGVNI